MKQISLWITDEQWEYLNRKAPGRGDNMSEIVRVALDKFIAQEEPQKGSTREDF